VRAIVRVLLLEFSNRNASGRSAEIPLWLSEGLSEQMLAASTIDLVVQQPEMGATGPPSGGTAREERKVNPLARVHDHLRGQPPLTLEELSWPAEEQLAGEQAELYRNSAQLFVHELLRLKDGRACLRAMLAGLARNLNWQTAFFRAFDAHFQRQLDLEKWWALQVVHFTGYGPAQHRSNAESCQELDAVMRTPVQVSVSSDTLPQHAEVSLQAIIEGWDYPRQRNALQAKIQQLWMLRLRVSPLAVTLVDNYRQVLEAYLSEAGKTGFAPATKPVRPAFRRMVEQTIRQLDALDARRETLRNSPDAANQPNPN